MISLVQQALTNSVCHLFLQKGRRRRRRRRRGGRRGRGVWGAADTIIQGYTRLLSLVCHYRQLKPDIAPLDWIFIKYVEGEALIEKRHEHERRRKVASGLFFVFFSQRRPRLGAAALTHMRAPHPRFSDLRQTRFISPCRTSESAAGFFRFFLIFCSVNFSQQLGKAGGEATAKSAWRAAAICQHMLSFLSQSDHYGPIGNKQMSSSAWQSTMMNNHVCDGVTRVTGAPCHRDKVTQGDGGAADQTLRQAGRRQFSSWSVRQNKVYCIVDTWTDAAFDAFSEAERISQVMLWFRSGKKYKENTK